MKKFILTFGLVLLMASFVWGQTSSQASTQSSTSTTSNSSPAAPQSSSSAQSTTTQPAGNNLPQQPVENKGAPSPQTGNTGVTSGSSTMTGSTAQEQGSTATASSQDSTMSSLAPGSNVCVNISSNGAILSGQVPSPDDAQKAQQFAQSLAGNGKIVNQLTTKNSGSASSSGLSSNSGSSMTPVMGGSGAALSPGSNVCVNISNNNQAILTGQVPSQADLDHVKSLAQSLAGSDTIVNQITTAAH